MEHVSGITAQIGVDINGVRSGGCDDPVAVKWRGSANSKIFASDAAAVGRCDLAETLITRPVIF